MFLDVKKKKKGTKAKVNTEMIISTLKICKLNLYTCETLKKNMLYTKEKKIINLFLLEMNISSHHENVEIRLEKLKC